MVQHGNTLLFWIYIYFKVTNQLFLFFLKIYPFENFLLYCIHICMQYMSCCTVECVSVNFYINIIGWRLYLLAVNIWRQFFVTRILIFQGVHSTQIPLYTCVIVVLYVRLYKHTGDCGRPCHKMFYNWRWAAVGSESN